MRIASIMYATSLCCTPCATSIYDSKLFWPYIAIVHTMSIAMMQTMICCSYIILNSWISKNRLLYANVFAQSVVALISAALPLGVGKMVALAEMPTNYNPATYYLLFVIGAVLSVMTFFSSLFASGEELIINKNENVNQMEMKEITTCNNKSSGNSV